MTCRDLGEIYPHGVSMDVFQLRDTIVDDYGQFIRSFHQIKDQRIRLKVESALEDGLLWPEVMAVSYTHLTLPTILRV